MAAWLESLRMAGPLMPQWVISSGSCILYLVDGMETIACSTTVPMRLVRASSLMLKVKRLGAKEVSGVERP